MEFLNQTLFLLAAAGGDAHGADHAEKEDVIQALGIHWEKILAQVILFLIVYLILKKFAFGPIMAILEDRQQRIAKGEENLKKIAADLAAAEARQSEIVNNANTKADKMISDARESADSLGEKKRVEATNEAAAIVAKAREAGDLERSQILTELKRDFGRLVIDTTGKVTGKVLTSEDQERINTETAGQLSL